jgi:hypothetical protein
MNIKTVLKNTAAIVGMPFVLAPLAHADLIENGQFTSLTLINGAQYAGSASDGGQLGYNIDATSWTSSSVSDGYGYNFVFNPSSVASGINSQYGNLALWTTGNGGLDDVTAAPNGGNILASDGGFSGHLAPITQTINGLTPGDTYAVSFYYAGAQQEGFNGATTEAWQIGLGGTIPGSATPNTPILSNASHGFTGWKEATVDVTATSASQTLWFLAYGTPEGVPPFTLLSDISMEVVPTPEPSSLIGGGLVLLAFGGSTLRKFRKQKQA